MILLLVAPMRTSELVDKEIRNGRELDSRGDTGTDQ